MDIFSVEYCQCRSSAESRNEGVNIFYSYHRFSSFFSEVLLPFAICSFPLRTRIDSRFVRVLKFARARGAMPPRRSQILFAWTSARIDIRVGALAQKQIPE